MIQLPSTTVYGVIKPAEKRGDNSAKPLSVFCDGGATNNGRPGAVGATGVWFGKGHPLNEATAYGPGDKVKVTNNTMECWQQSQRYARCSPTSCTHRQRV